MDRIIKDRPFFSIVMPTYNRGHLIGNAIQSVLAQTFGDFELVVCSSGSDDNTGDVVRSFRDDRIRFVETDVKLKIGDNYQRALDHASGEFIGFLSDDDAFVPVMLESVKTLLDTERPDIIGFRFCLYNHEEGKINNVIVPANSLELPNFTHKAKHFTGHDSLKQVFRINALTEGRVDSDFIVPYLANAIYKRSVFDRVRQTKNQLFASTPADMYLAAAVFYVSDSYICLDSPLHLWSRWGGSATAVPSHHQGNLRSHYEKLLDGKTLEFTPLKFALLSNCIANALLTARSDFRFVGKDIEVDWCLYYIVMYKYLISFSRHGIDVEEELNEFRERIAGEDKKLKNRVNKTIQIWSGEKKPTPALQLKSIVKAGIRRFAPSIWESITGSPAIETEPELVKGDTAGFLGILEASEYLRRRFF